MGKPELTCDLVMKGGITSGVIYPGVIDKLKDKYQFRSIGGTSAGAIAASLLAAAEYRRQGDGSQDGFQVLRDLPNLLGKEKDKKSLLFRFFEPQQSTKRLFDLMTSFLRSSWTEDNPKEPILQRLPRIIYNVGKAYWYLPLVIFILTALLLRLNWDMLSSVPAARWTLLICLLLLAILITLIALGVAFVRDVGVNLVGNHLGLCRGSGDPKKPSSESDALSDWLERTLDRAAGLQGDLRAPFDLTAMNNPSEAQTRGPLTFAHLESRGVKLKMFTTCLSRGIPLTVPFAQKAIYFKPGDLEGYFSERIINYLKTFSRPSSTATTYNQNKLESEKIYALPHCNNLPVVVAVRLSMSFPVLFSAVPFYMRKHTTPTLKLDPDTGEPDPKGDTWELERVYFVDGGICSNFPVDFFDSPLPSRPTFAINLVPTSEAAPENSEDHVWMPQNNHQGVLPPWNLLSNKKGLGQLLAYATAMFETGFTWRDTYQGLAAASRDRICHIKVYKGSNEGGLNLNMPPELIEELSKRGEQGGEKILKTFHNGAGWRNHRWLRFRNVLSAQDTFQRVFAERVQNKEVKPDFEDLIDAPPSADWKNNAQRDFGKGYLKDFCEFVEKYEREGEAKKVKLQDNAPSPVSNLKTMVDPSSINLG
jgi:predicted acylesterase/phospholipase RssA